jgi:hypothetical protein
LLGEHADHVDIGQALARMAVAIAAATFRMFGSISSVGVLVAVI